MSARTASRSGPVAALFSGASTSDRVLCASGAMASSRPASLPALAQESADGSRRAQRVKRAGFWVERTASPLREVRAQRADAEQRAAGRAWRDVLGDRRDGLKVGIKVRQGIGLTAGLAAQRVGEDVLVLEQRILHASPVVAEGDRLEREDRARVEIARGVDFDKQRVGVDVALDLARVDGGVPDDPAQVRRDPSRNSARWSPGSSASPYAALEELVELLDRDRGEAIRQLEDLLDVFSAH